MIFKRGIDTVKITALSNHKPGILNNYIRMLNIHVYNKILISESYGTVVAKLKIWQR
jgi:hypothetical protein